MCLSPVIMIGYAFTMMINNAHSTSLDGPIVEAQTCRRHWGAYASVIGSGFYTAGLQYGIGLGRVTIQPFVGVSYVDHVVFELPLRTQFDLGVRANIAVGATQCAVKYEHASNAGLRQPNNGVDLVSIGCGMEF